MSPNELEKLNEYDPQYQKVQDMFIQRMERNERKVPLLQPGDSVRIATIATEEYKKNQFKKVINTFTKEIYKIKAVLNGNNEFLNPRYLLSNNETYDGHHLLKVNTSELIVLPPKQKEPTAPRIPVQKFIQKTPPRHFTRRMNPLR
jgi:hypothetical protein